MIAYPNTFREYIEARGVGQNDVVASSPDKYSQILNTVSGLLQVGITPASLRSEADVQHLCQQLIQHRAASTIGDYQSVLRQYVSMVSDYNL
jgi:hypothetical protein